jgi:hypothetical protein
MEDEDSCWKEEKREQAVNVNAVTMSPLSSSHNVLRTRALQCSFSSVYHLRRAGMSAKDADLVENIFACSVGLPLLCLGAAGLLALFRKEENE